MENKLHCAVVTPYYKENRYLLDRCLSSVKNQTFRADHLLIADGHPQGWLDQAGVRHLKLDRSHGDYGNTPRGIGALLAIGEEYDAILLLDADNWLENEHIEYCVRMAEAKFGNIQLCDYVIARRKFIRTDGTAMPLDEEEGHVDTNCFFFLRGSFHLLPFWATMPKALSPICDRVFYQILQNQQLQWAECLKPTVNYHSVWASYYRMIGEEPPDGTKDNVDARPILKEISTWSERKRAIASRLAGGLNEVSV